MQPIDIGVLTFWNTQNYGAALQCFALTHAIERLGRTVEVVRYRSHAIEGAEGLSSDVSNWTPKRLVKQALFGRQMRARRLAFNDFQQKYLPLGVECGQNDMDSASERYRKIVVGSDQVWNGGLTGNDTVFLLDFISDSSRKAAYAASVGSVAADDQNVSWLSPYISSFARILVREASAVGLVKSMAPEADVEAVLDPTLLFDRAEWEHLLKDSFRLGDPYILLYMVNERDEAERAARLLSEKYSCKVVCVHSRVEPPIVWADNIYDLKPSDFPHIFFGAKAVVTSSFHGVCFSILGNKEFYYSLPSNTGDSMGKNSRIVDLIKAIGLDLRPIGEDGRIPECRFSYDEVNEAVAELRGHSLHLLNSVIL